jgi:hypothetical protein
MRITGTGIDFHSPANITVKSQHLLPLILFIVICETWAGMNQGKIADLATKAAAGDATALVQLKKAAERQEAVAQNALAVLYLSGRG